MGSRGIGIVKDLLNLSNVSDWQVLVLPFKCSWKIGHPHPQVTVLFVFWRQNPFLSPYTLIVVFNPL